MARTEYAVETEDFAERHGNGSAALNEASPGLKRGDGVGFVVLNGSEKISTLRMLSAVSVNPWSIITDPEG